MADIKTMTQEVAALYVDLRESMLQGNYPEVIKVLEKVIEKLDEIVEKVN